jgi:hypothetical protein
MMGLADHLPLVGYAEESSAMLSEVHSTKKDTATQPQIQTAGPPYISPTSKDAATAKTEGKTLTDPLRNFISGWQLI